MSAFGNITCGYCGEEYHELDKHGCCITALHDTIERLQENSKELNRRIYDLDERILDLEGA